MVRQKSVEKARGAFKTTLVHDMRREEENKELSERRSDEELRELASKLEGEAFQEMQRLKARRPSAEEYNRDILDVMAQVAQRRKDAPAGGAAALKPAEPATPGSYRFRPLSPDNTEDDDSNTGGSAAAGENNPYASTGAPAAGSGSEKRARVDGATDVSSAGVVAAPAPVNVVDQQAAKLTFYELQQLMLPPSRRDKPPPYEKKKRKKEKKDKDPNMPKKPASAWTMYRSANLQQHQKDHCCTSREAQTALGAAWKILGDAEKKIYTDKYDAAQEMYLKERQDYLASKEGAVGASASAAPAASGGGGAKVGTTGGDYCSQPFEFSDSSSDDEAEHAANEEEEEEGDRNQSGGAATAAAAAAAASDPERPSKRPRIPGEDAGEETAKRPRKIPGGQA
eukprot:gene8186-9903_t